MNPSRSPALVLVADDDLNLRKIVTVFLKNAHFDVLEARNGKEALDLIRKERPDAVLMDVMMPVMDGYTICRTLKEDPLTRSIPVILCTARGRKEDLIAGIRCGADDYIVKPFHRDTVLAKVNHVLKVGAGAHAAPAEVETSGSERRDSARKAAGWSLSWGVRDRGDIAPLYKSRVLEVSLTGLSFEFVRCQVCTGYEKGTVHPLCLFTRHARRFHESDPLDLVLSVSSDVILEIQGKVAHVYQWPENPATERVGVMFTRIADESRDEIRRYLEGAGRP